MTATPSAPTPVRYPSSDGLEISAFRWDPDGPPRGIVQLTHGMGEHIMRYAPLAQALNRHGFVVYGQDHRGHGTTARSDAELGQVGEDGWALLVGDIDRLVGVAREAHPGLPLLLIAHSMGSFAAQQYLPQYPGRVDAVALTGTGALDLLEPALDLDAPLSLEMFNAPFEQRTGFEWLSRDEEQVDLYVADPHCGFGLDGGSVRAMFTAARQLADPEYLSRIPHDLPVLVAVGALDPVNAGLALLEPVVQRYEAAGLTDVTRIVYPEARHEIFNETNRDEVVADLLAWIDRTPALADPR